jgi:hypothetical protein
LASSSSWRTDIEMPPCVSSFSFDAGQYCMHITCTDSQNNKLLPLSKVFILNQFHETESILKAKRHSDGQEILCPLQNYHVHVSLRLDLFWARWNQAISSHPISLQYILIIISQEGSSFTFPN